jgi:hypothetical protein
LRTRLALIEKTYDGGFVIIAHLLNCYTVIERIFPFRGFQASALALLLALVPGGLGLQPGGHSPSRPGG